MKGLPRRHGEALKAVLFSVLSVTPWFRSLALSIFELKSLTRFRGVEIKHGTAIGGPLVNVVDKYGSRAAQVAYRFHLFHIATFNGLEADGCCHKGKKCVLLWVDSKQRVALKFACQPAQPTRLTRGGCLLEK